MSTVTTQIMHYEAMPKMQDSNLPLPANTLQALSTALKQFWQQVAVCGEFGWDLIAPCYRDQKLNDLGASIEQCIPGLKIAVSCSCTLFGCVHPSGWAGEFHIPTGRLVADRQLVNSGLTWEDNPVLLDQLRLYYPNYYYQSNFPQLHNIARSYACVTAVMSQGAESSPLGFCDFRIVENAEGKIQALVGSPFGDTDNFPDEYLTSSLGAVLPGIQNEIPYTQLREQYKTSHTIGHQLFVAKPYRGLGLGAALFECALQTAGSLGAEYYLLNSADDATFKNGPTGPSSFYARYGNWIEDPNGNLAIYIDKV